jgi:glycosyltransferase involved in cell wall biosynthesis
MESGGVSKSMSSLLNVIDTDRYEVDCFILSPKGIFLDSIPKEINIISDSKTGLFFSKFPNNILNLISKGHFYDAFIRLLAAFFMQINKGWGGYLLSRRIFKINKEYDLAVDYNGQHQLYYLIDSIKAKKKISFFHNDYEKWAYYYSMDKKYMPKADAVFTISEQCSSSLKKYFPKIKQKIGIFENISSVQLIEQLASIEIKDTLNKKTLSIITIGHVSERKGSSLALKAAYLLKERGLNFKWYFLGKVTNTTFYKSLVQELKLEKQIEFMGLRKNPYPYIKQADLVVHSATFEGKSIALDEAKLLCKPIVVTNFSTVNDQFTNRVNASICEMNAKDLARCIVELIQNENLRNSYIAELKKNKKDNTSEIENLYRFLTD